MFAMNNSDFFNTLNFLFADHKDFAEGARKVYQTDIENSNQQFLSLGSPEMEDMCKVFETQFEHNLNKKRKSVLWAPRWTYDNVMGGSHFIEYKDNFTALRKKYPDLSLIVRPHPLTFPTMIREKRMTENEVELYKKSLRDNDIYLDDCVEKYGLETLKSTYEKSDIMIADITSIINLYFMTGNPIIYCQKGFKTFGYSKMMEPALYIANSWEEVEKYLEMLLSGEDPLKEERRRLIREIQKMNIGAAERIVQTIIDDYRKTNLRYD